MKRSIIDSKQAAGRICHLIHILLLNFCSIHGSFTIPSWNARSRKDTSTEKTPIFLTSVLWTPFYNSFNCLFSYCCRPGSSLRRTKEPLLSETKTISTRHIQNMNIMNISSTAIIPSFVPCYCSTKQSWNSLGSYNFNEIINDIRIFHVNFSSHLVFVVIVFDFVWVFFSIMSLGHTQRHLKTDSPQSHLSEGESLSWHKFR